MIAPRGPTNREQPGLLTGQGAPLQQIYASVDSAGNSCKTKIFEQLSSQWRSSERQIPEQPSPEQLRIRPENWPLTTSPKSAECQQAASDQTPTFDVRLNNSFIFRGRVRLSISPGRTGSICQVRLVLTVEVLQTAPGLPSLSIGKGITFSVFPCRIDFELARVLERRISGYGPDRFAGSHIILLGAVKLAKCAAGIQPKYDSGAWIRRKMDRSSAMPCFALPCLKQAPIRRRNTRPGCCPHRLSVFGLALKRKRKASLPTPLQVVFWKSKAGIFASVVDPNRDFAVRIRQVRIRQSAQKKKGSRSPQQEPFQIWLSNTESVSETHSHRFVSEPISMIL